MAITDKYGNIYNLNKPNPILSTQTIWPKDEKVYIHNKIGKRYLESKEVIDEEQPIKKIYPNEEMVEIWCLPCESYKIVTDTLYDNSYTKVNYGEKFLFKAQILQLEDLYIQLFTNRDIKEGSILFPRTKGKRWWKVIDVNKNIVNAMISDYQPSFSDQEN